VILDDILDHRRTDVALIKEKVPLNELAAICSGLPPARGFVRSLRDRSANGTAIIAEVKKASPSKGVIREDFNPVKIAETYQQAGAACISVLTEMRYFQGDLGYLDKISRAVSIPLLRKDFIVDPYQIYEARVFNADAVLLIAAALSDAELCSYTALADKLGLDVLLEVHNEAELERALEIPVTLIGINNRDLSTFVTDIAVTERLIKQIPSDRLVVSESGIRQRTDITRLQTAGAGAFLVGEHLMRAPDTEACLRQLLGDDE